LETKFRPNRRIFVFGGHFVPWLPWQWSPFLLRIDIHRWFAMAAILNPKWPPKYKNPPIWMKFGFQVDFDVGN
jgi:hypothetical protein